MSVSRVRRFLSGRSLPALFLLAALLAAGCNKGSGAGNTSKLPEVVVTTPIYEEVIDYQDFTGRLNAVKTVSVRARVSGYISKETTFKEGDLVKLNDLLFEIDSRSYKADLDKAVADVHFAEAELELQKKTFDRMKRLYDQKGVPDQEYEVAKYTYEKNIANVKSLQAVQERAQLYADWTKVQAPLTGRISLRQVDPYNLIAADTTILATIVTESPMYVYFDVDERTFLEMRAAASVWQGTSSDNLKYPVLLRLANEDEFKHLGYVDSVDNQVNSGTGTIRMRGVFDNPQGLFRAGLFARIRLPISKVYRTILIPDEALMSDQGRKYVYVVKKQQTKEGKEVEVVEYRKVMFGPSIEGLRVIRPAAKGMESKEGVQNGERIIVQGMQRVRPESEVTVQTQPPPQAPDSPLVKFLTKQRADEASKKPLGAE